MTPGEVDDHLEITRLLYLYARAIDTRDWRLLTSLFTPEAVIDYRVERGTRLGLDDLVRWLRESLRIFDRTHHVMTNPLIELRGDEARSTIYLTATHVQVALDGREATTTLHGVYRDVHERTGEGWRIRERILEGVHIQGEFLPPDRVRSSPRGTTPA